MENFNQTPQQKAQQLIRHFTLPIMFRRQMSKRFAIRHVEEIIICSHKDWLGQADSILTSHDYYEKVLTELKKISL